MVRKKQPVGLEPLNIGLLASDEQVAALVHERGVEEARRMNALADSMGIPNDINRWYAVALELARRHVPELQENKVQGRAKKWGPYELGMLVVEIEREQGRESPAKTQKDAAKALAMRSPWKDLLSTWSVGSHVGSDPGEALLAQYKKAVKLKWAKLNRYAFQLHVATDTIAEWDRLVHLVKENKENKEKK